MKRATKFLAVIGFALILADASPSQTSWGLRPTLSVPPARGYQLLVFDPLRSNTVMFGGLIDGGYTALGDTWIWNGTDWNQVFPTHSPSARWGTMACFDPSRGTVVMFGGEQFGPNYLADTWEWNGSDWTQIVTTAPPARSFGGMAFDAVNQAPLLFGGLYSSGHASFGDQWRFAAGTWTLVGAATLPPARSGAVYCADPIRREIVCQGGFDNLSSTFRADCWVWNGANWISQPSARGAYEHSSASFDSLRNRIVAFGGSTPGVGGTSDTWEWDGQRWSLRTPPIAPPPMEGARSMFDPTTRRTLLFGGRLTSGNGNNYSADTWDYELYNPASFETYGFGCIGTNALRPRLDNLDGSLPWVSESWTLRVSDIPAGALAVWGLIGHSRAVAAGLQLPLDLGLIGMPGCLMQMSGDVGTFPIPLSSQSPGHADWQIHNPWDLSLVGTSLFMQAAVLDLGANALGLTVSNGGHAIPGLK